MRTRSTGVRGLVFGGIMAALVIVFAVVPMLSIFMPIPLVLVYVRYGGRTALLTSVVAVIFSVLLVGPVQAISYLVPAGILPGLAFGYGFRRKLRPIVIGVIAVAVSIMGYAATYVITRAAVMGGRDPIAVAVQSPEARQLIDPIISAMEKATALPSGATEAQKQQAERVKAQIDEIKQDPAAVTWALLPSSLLFFGAASSWLNYMLCRWILPRFGHEIPAPTPFSEFWIPSWLTWVFVAALYGQTYMGPSLINAPWWVKVLLNVVSPLSYIFVLVGMAGAYGFLRKKEISKQLSLLFILLGLLLFGWSIGVQLYIMLAMWDSIFDFRGLGHGLLKRPKTTP
ncbi:MAG: DUF2232 domain-containing protein [Mycobacterium leprae]